MVRIESERLYMVNATDEDIPAIIELENHPENRDFIWQGTVEEHMSEIRDGEHLLLIFRRKEDDALAGYTLIHQNFKSHIFEIRRIALVFKRQGYGREAMNALIRYAFEETETNRLWLDVYTDHPVGIHLYESLGMHKDGTLRQSYLSDRGYLDQIIYSLLRSEYEERKTKA